VCSLYIVARIGAFVPCPASSIITLPLKTPDEAEVEAEVEAKPGVLKITDRLIIKIKTIILRPMLYDLSILTDYPCALLTVYYYIMKNQNYV